MHALEITKTKKVELARAINVQPQTVQHLCQGNVQSSKFTFEIATVLGINMLWLATGEGEMFIVDTPEQKLRNEYKSVPIISLDQIQPHFDTNNIGDKSMGHILLKTNHLDIMCTLMQDSSMLPIIPKNSQIFFKKVKSDELLFNKIVIAYLKDAEYSIIRTIKNESNTTYLLPQNTQLFKEVILTDNIVIIGQVVQYNVMLN